MNLTDLICEKVSEQNIQKNTVLTNETVFLKKHKMKKFINSVKEIMNTYIIDPKGGDWQVDHRLVHLWNITYCSDHYVSLTLAPYSNPLHGFELTFEGRFIDYTFNVDKNLYEIEITGLNNKKSISSEDDTRLYNHFSNQIAALYVQQDPITQQFWKIGKCNYCRDIKQLFYVKNTRADEIDLEPGRSWWGSRVFWVCDKCIVGRTYVKVTGISNTLGAFIEQPTSIRDKI